MAKFKIGFKYKRTDCNYSYFIKKVINGCYIYTVFYGNEISTLNHNYPIIDFEKEVVKYKIVGGGSPKISSILYG